MKNFKIKDYFSKNLYIESLNQTKITGFFLIIASIILCSLHPFVELVSYLQRPGYQNTQTIGVLGGNIALIILTYMIPMFMAFTGFEFLSKRKDCDFYHSIPVKRESIFTSFALAGITWIFASLIIGGLFSITLFACVPSLKIPIAGCFNLIGSLLTGALMIYFGSLLAISISGNKLTQTLLAFAIIFLPQIASLLFRSIIDDITTITVLKIATATLPIVPFSALFGGFSSGAESIFSLQTAAVTLTYAIVCAILAGIAFTKRKSELAGNNAPSKLVQHVYRMVVMLPFVLLGVSMLYESVDISAILIVIAISFVIYIGYELATTRNYKSAIKSVPLYLIPIALVVITTLCLHGVALAIGGISPSADKIKSVNIQSTFSMGTPNSKYGEERSKHEITDKEIIEIVADSLAESVEGGMRMTFADENGKQSYYLGYVKINTGLASHSRKIYLTTDEKDQIEEYFANQTYLNQYLVDMPKKEDILITKIHGAGIESYSYIEESVINEFLDIMYEEFYSLSVEDQYKVYAHKTNPNVMPVFAGMDTGYIENVFEYRVNLTTLGKYDSELTSIYINQLMPKSYEYLLNYSYNNQVVKKDDIASFLNGVDEKSELNISVEIQGENKKLDIIRFNGYTQNEFNRYTNADCVAILQKTAQIVDNSQIKSDGDLYSIQINCENMSEYEKEEFYDNEIEFYVSYEFITTLTDEDLAFFKDMQNKTVN